MNKSGQKNNADFLAGMIVLAIFAAGTIAALLSGAGAYRRLTERDENEYEIRICTQYIATKISGAESTDAVFVEQAEELGVPVLCIRDKAGEESCVSYIYLYDGWICELYTLEKYQPDFSAGEKLVQAGGLEFSITGNLFTAGIISDSGEERIVHVCIGESSSDAKGAAT